MHGEVFQEGEGLVLREESFEDVTGAVDKVLPETPAVVGALAVAPPPFPYQLFLEGGEAVWQAEPWLPQGAGCSNNGKLQ